MAALAEMSLPICGEHGGEPVDLSGSIALQLVLTAHKAKWAKSHRNPEGLSDLQIFPNMGVKYGLNQCFWMFWPFWLQNAHVCCYWLPVISKCYFSYGEEMIEEKNKLFLDGAFKENVTCKNCRAACWDTIMDIWACIWSMWKGQCDFCN